MTEGHAPIVELVDAGKRYVKFVDLPLLLTRLRFRAENTRAALWAVRHVDLTVPRGETLGVIGRNGSGKSTMLRMLAGVTAPSEGSVTVRGRVAPLISVGVGFHPELTGRENVYVNGSILGMSRAETDRLFDSIVDFAELEEFIDTPVKFYSSGMFVRLGFSVAVASRPDVLLVDEILAVGDLQFQAKCYERMLQIKREGTSILVVSHNVNAIRRLCTRVLVLHDGDPRYLGDTDEAISAYHDLLATTERHERGIPDDAHAPIELGALELIGPAGPTKHVHTGEKVTFRIEARFYETVNNPTFVFRLTSEAGHLIYNETTYRTGTRRFEQGEKATFEVVLPMNLVTASYTALAGVQWGEEAADRALGRPATFFVSGRPMVKGMVDLLASLQVSGPDGRPVPTHPGVEARPEPQREVAPVEPEDDVAPVEGGGLEIPPTDFD